jgi:predicted porin
LTRVIPGSDAWDVWNNASRLGVRGEEDLGGGLSAIYQYEFGVDVTEGDNFNSNRPKWVGLKGNSWGSVTAGTQWTPYYNVMGIGDIFNSSKTYTKMDYLGIDYGHRMDNMVMYASPSWNGFGFQAAMVMNGDAGNSDPETPAGLTKCSPNNKLYCNLSNSVDMWQLNATYKNGPFFVGATGLWLDGSDFDGYYYLPQNGRPDAQYMTEWDGYLWGLAFGYNSGPFSVSLSYEAGDAQGLYYGEADNILLTGKYTFGNNVVYGAYTHVTPDKSKIVFTGNDGSVTTHTQDEIDNYRLGYQYNLSKRTRLWAEWLMNDVDSSLVGSVNTISIGTRHDF